MVKFLRRSTGDTREAAFPFLEELEISLSRTDEPPEAGALAREILDKIQILQNRAKKIRLIRAAARLETDWAALLLVGLLGDPIEEIRGLAVRELIARDDCPMEEVCERLTRPPWFAKSAALQILAAKKSPGTARFIRAVIEDSSADVRRSAASALGEIGGAEARALLVSLGKDASPYVRAAAQAALEKICDFKFT